MSGISQLDLCCLALENTPTAPYSNPLPNSAGGGGGANALLPNSDSCKEPEFNTDSCANIIYSSFISNLNSSLSQQEKLFLAKFIDEHVQSYLLLQAKSFLTTQCQDIFSLVQREILKRQTTLLLSIEDEDIKEPGLPTTIPLCIQDLVKKTDDATDISRAF